MMLMAIYTISAYVYTHELKLIDFTIELAPIDNSRSVDYIKSSTSVLVVVIALISSLLTLLKDE